MTPKEKAQKLFDLMFEEIYNKGMYDDVYRAKQCALITVNEILELKETQEEYQIQYDNGEYSREIGYRYSKYWQEVKQELEKI